MTAPLFRDVADTAAWVAAYRAKESERPDALFRDPLAGRLAGDRGRELAREVVGARNFDWSVVIRTCILDDLIASAVAGGVDTVLNLGAGLDTRPYRLPLPATLRWVEVDHAKILDLKEEQLRGETPACSITRIAVDLSNAPDRRKLLADVDRESARALVLTEGVVGYLSNDEVAALARDLRKRAHVSQWIVDYVSPRLRRAMQRRRRVQGQFRNTPFRFHAPDWEGFFRDRGWKVATMRYHVDEGERRGRPVPLPWWVRLVANLVPGKREEIRRMMAFAVLEPDARSRTAG
jgi:methyltransferase (TIGR00027 family)